MNRIVPKRLVSLSLFFTFLFIFTGQSGAALPLVENVETQPFFASMERLLESMDYVGAPVREEDLEQIKTLLKKEES